MRMILKQFLAFVLCLSILFSNFSVYGEAFDEKAYNERVASRYWSSFDIDDGMYYENLINTENYGYTLWADAIDSKGSVSHAFLWATNVLLDKNWNEEAYAEYLSKILAMMDRGFEESVLARAEYTSKVNGLNYAGEVLELSLQQVFGTAKLKKLEKTIKLFFDTKDLVKLGVTKITDTTQLYFLLMASASYEKKCVLLETIQEDSKDKKLKNAAKDLRMLMDMEFAYVILNYKEEFMSDVMKLGFDAADSDFWKKFIPLICTKLSNGFVPWLMDHGAADLGDSALSALSVAKKYASTVGLFAATMQLTGKTMALFVGDQAEMFREMKVMDAISDTLSKSLIDANNQVAASTDKKQYENIYKYVTLGEAMTYVHMRGEYCMTEIDKQQGEDPALKGMYFDKVAKSLNSSYEIFNTILPEPEIKHVVNENFELKDGFISEINQLTDVPQGYIGIYDFNDLMAITNDPSGNYILMNDISCGAYELVVNELFEGTFDGNGYTISNIKNPLFGYLNGATVKNLGMKVKAAVHYQQEKQEGVVFNPLQVGYWGTLTSFAGESVIDNCYVEGKIYITETEDKMIETDVGGLVGKSNLCGITNCYNKSDVTIEYHRGAVRLGGLVGYSQVYFSDKFEDDYTEINNCFNEGELIVKADKIVTSNVGGICGFSFDVNYNCCYNSADVTAYSTNNSNGLLYGDELNAGGICGNTSNANVEACWNSGNIKAQNEAAVLEKREDTRYEYHPVEGKVSAGGVIGYIGSSVNMQKCLNTGEINGRSYAGGLVGVANGDSWFVNSYNTGKIIGQYLAGGIAGLGGAQHSSEFYLGNCYTVGAVSTEASLGGQFAGYLVPYGKYEQCFYITNGRENATGTENKSNGIKKVSNEELYSEDTYQGFDFQIVWEFDEENSIVPMKLRF